MQANPFTRRNFSGRHRDTPIVLYGQRRTGKTSVLYQMHRHLDPRYRCIFIDLHGLNLNGMENLLWGIASSIRRGLQRDHQLRVAIPDRATFSANPQAAFETTFLDAVWSILGKDHLVLMIDEVVRLHEEVKAGRLEREVFDYLRHLMQHFEHLNFVFSLGSGVEEMKLDYAFLFGVALYHRISFLEPGAARALVTKPVQGCYQVMPDAVEKILQITTGHPYYTQLVCHCLFDRWLRAPKPHMTSADVEAVLPEAIELGSANLTYVWEDSTPEEQATMAGMAAAISTKGCPATVDQIRKVWRKAEVQLPAGEATNAVRSLTAREVIVASDGAYSFAVDLQRLWLDKHRRLDWVKEELAETTRIWAGPARATWTGPAKAETSAYAIVAAVAAMVCALSASQQILAHGRLGAAYSLNILLAALTLFGAAVLTFRRSKYAGPGMIFGAALVTVSFSIESAFYSSGSGGPYVAAAVVTTVTAAAAAVSSAVYFAREARQGRANLRGPLVVAAVAAMVCALSVSLQVLAHYRLGTAYSWNIALLALTLFGAAVLTFGRSKYAGAGMIFGAALVIVSIFIESAFYGSGSGGPYVAATVVTTVTAAAAAVSAAVYFTREARQGRANLRRPLVVAFCVAAIGYVVASIPGDVQFGFGRTWFTTTGLLGPGVHGRFILAGVVAVIALAIPVVVIERLAPGTGVRAGVVAGWLLVNGAGQLDYTIFIGQPGIRAAPAFAVTWVFWGLTAALGVALIASDRNAGVSSALTPSALPTQ